MDGWGSLVGLVERPVDQSNPTQQDKQRDRQAYHEPRAACEVAVTGPAGRRRLPGQDRTTTTTTTTDWRKRTGRPRLVHVEDGCCDEYKWGEMVRQCVETKNPKRA
jgi:hypothetical protein